MADESMSTGGDVRPREADEYEDDDWHDPEHDPNCSWCGGDAYVETDDPLWDGFNAIVPCSACGGSGRAKDQTVW